MTPPASLPQELIDNAIDLFHDDLINLRSFSLVCRAWLPSCRSHIFRTVSLQPPNVAARGSTPAFTHSQRLHRIIHSSPGIAQYVRNLVICEGIVQREWISQDKALPALLGSLQNLERFQLERSASMRIVWKTIPQILRTAIIGVLASPSLLELKLTGLVFERPGELLQILQSCRILRVLQVNHLAFGDESSLHLNSVASIAHKPESLDVLSVGPRTSTALIRCLLHPESTINVTSIRKLSVCISGNFPDVSQLLKSSTSVEVLELALMNDIDLQVYWSLPATDRIDLSHNPHLHTLELKLDVIQRQDDPLPWLNAIFSTVRIPNAIRTINIVYSIYLPSPYMDRSVNTTIFDEWTGIDATLTGLEFSHLKKVKLDFALENPIGSGIAPRFLEEVVLHSPALKASGLLEIGAFDTS